MTSAEIRRGFLEFFREKGHALVPSATLLPASSQPLFTAAGGERFTPLFLGKEKCPYDFPRAVGVQKCIRAGGRYNDLEETGFDTGHGTFFKMLGNRSFGDYFKAEAIGWAWELLVNRWQFPPNRLYVTVYRPAEGDPGELDQEAYVLWTRLFASCNLDPKEHIILGNRKDNFRTMGESGPCGPCSDLHIDVTPAGNTRGSLVNKNDPRCLKIWNLTFLQYTANQDGSLTPLPARHVDTGMGLERLTSVIQGTDGFRFFDPRRISNYNTDLFQPLFALLEKISGKRYGATVPTPGATGLDAEEALVDTAFRVLADHARTLTFAIADGILPSSEGRGYVLRRLLRRAVRYGRVLGFQGSFLHELIPVVIRTMREVFPEAVEQEGTIVRIVRDEEESFAGTIDRGLEIFSEAAGIAEADGSRRIRGADAFDFFEKSGFPLDLTQLLARERNLGIDLDGFQACLLEKLKAKQSAQPSPAAQPKEEAAVPISTGAAIELPATIFVGYETLETAATVLRADGEGIVLDRSPFYPESEGQVGDTGRLFVGETPYLVENTTVTREGLLLHKLRGATSVAAGQEVRLQVDGERRQRIAANHSALHLLHWALRELLGPSVQPKGAHIGPDFFHLDFSWKWPITGEHLSELQKLMVTRIEENAPISVSERAWGEIESDPSILRFTEEPYGESVRVVEIGDYSKELCRGTHISTLGQLGFIKILMDGEAAPGVRRIEVVAGEALTEHVLHELPKQDEKWQHLREKKSDLTPLREFKRQAGPRENWRELLSRQEDLFLLEAEVRRKGTTINRLSDKPPFFYTNSMLT